MGRIPSRGSDQFVVRFPVGMRDRIREAAEANGRSMNAEIIAALEREFPPPPIADVLDVWAIDMSIRDASADEAGRIIDRQNKQLSQRGMLFRYELVHVDGAARAQLVPVSNK